jgi:hypothetical protein
VLDGFSDANKLSRASSPSPFKAADELGLFPSFGHSNKAQSNAAKTITGARHPVSV